MEIPETHPLQQLFLELVGRHYAEEIGIRDPQVVGYVAHLLSEFCDVEQLLKIRNAAGKPLNDVGEMLIESDPIYGPAPSFDRERQVRKHIGDFTLFYAGMFPESINHYRLRRQRVENFVDWVKAGKESYYIVSKFRSTHWRLHAVLRRHVSGEHQPLSPAPPARGKFRGLGESGKRKLLHRLEVRRFRIREGGAAIRATVAKI